MLEHAWYFPRERYTLMPWRNGAGTTREIVREPAHTEPFDWRLSLATIEASGAFSSYPGYLRVVALVDGHGFRLDIKDARSHLLRKRGEHVLFAGAAQAACELLDGPCTELSLMVREPGAIEEVAYLQVDAEQRLHIACGMLQVLFVTHGAISCLAAPSTTGCERGSYPLHLNDTLVVRGDDSGWSLRRTASEPAQLMAITFSPPAPSALKSAP